MFFYILFWLQCKQGEIRKCCNDSWDHNINGCFDWFCSNSFFVAKWKEIPCCSSGIIFLFWLSHQYHHQTHSQHRDGRGSWHPSLWKAQPLWYCIWINWFLVAWQCNEPGHNYTPHFNFVEAGYTGFTLSVCPSVHQSIRPSVHLWTESCPLCIFNNTHQIHYIFAH